MRRTDAELIAKRDELMSRDIDQIAQIKAYGVDLDKKRQVDLINGLTGISTHVRQQPSQLPPVLRPGLL